MRSCCTSGEREGSRQGGWGVTVVEVRDPVREAIDLEPRGRDLL